MALVKFYNGNTENLDNLPIKEGQIIFSVSNSNGSIYYDSSNSNRIKMTALADRAVADNLGNNIGNTYISNLTGTTSKTNYVITPKTASGNNKTAITIPAASSTIAGLMTTETQTFSGNKTFNQTVTFLGSADASLGSYAYPAVTIGPYSSAHLEIDANEIMAKGSANSAANLYLNNEGGVVDIGPSGMNVRGHITSGATSNTLDIGTSSNYFRNIYASSFSGNAASATKLQTARTIRTNLGSTSTASFDGTASITPGITGTLSVSHGGTGATDAATARSNLGAAASNHTHSAVTTSANGFMSANDKNKLDSIANGANKYTHPGYTSRNSGLYKITVDATGHVSGVSAVTKSDITALGIPGQDTNTTYNVATTSTNGLMSAADKSKLNGIASGANNYSHPTSSGNKHIPSGGSSGQILRWSADGTATWGNDNNTTYSNFRGASTSAAGGSGLVPAPTQGSANRYLRSDGTWQVPPDTNTVYTHPTSAGNKHIPAGGSSGQILRWSSSGTAVWGADNNTTYGVATTSANGLMSASDKVKLNGIATNANNYVHPTSAGYKHIPSGGTSGQILRWSSSGTAVWDRRKIYSSSEVDTGNNWIDGKRIYRISGKWTGTIVNGGRTDIPLKISGKIDTVIHANVFSKAVDRNNSNYYSYFAVAYYNGDPYAMSFLIVDCGRVNYDYPMLRLITTGSMDTTGRTVIYTVEYTKV